MGSIHSKISNHRKPKFHHDEKIRKFPLHDAIRSRNYTSVKNILKQDIDIVNSTDDDGVTPLMVAAIYKLVSYFIPLELIFTNSAKTIIQH